MSARTVRFGLLLPVLALLGAIIASCAGSKARDTAVPAIAVIWEKHVRPEVEQGIVLAKERGLTDETAALAKRAIDEMSAALRTGERGALVLAAWISLSDFAFGGIQAREDKGEIGPGVAESLRERLLQFDKLLRKVVTS